MTYRTVLGVTELFDQKKHYDANMIHKAILTGGFGDVVATKEKTAREITGALFLTVEDEMRNLTSVIIHSEMKPTWTHETISPIFSIRLEEEFENTFQAGDVIQYHGVIRASRRLAPVGMGTRGKEIPIRNREEVFAWWERKANLAGLAITPEQTGIGDTPRELKTKRSKLKLIHHSISGLGTVVDPTLFKESFRLGIGSDKAFGAGLFIIRKAKS